MRELYKPGQAPLLRGAGKTGLTGPETETVLNDNIILYQDEFGSNRFVYYLDGKPISVLQVMGHKWLIGKKPVYIIANVRTEKKYRRKGYAALLLKKARELLGTIAHSSPDDQSEMGKAWAKAVKEHSMSNTSDIIVNNVEFASGQEPESESGFVTLLRVSYTVKDKKLAQILGKQMRVLDRYLKDVNKSDYSEKIKEKSRIIRLVTEDDDILIKVSKSIKNFIITYLVDEFGILDTPDIQVENAEESDLHYIVDINPTMMLINVETEFDVIVE